MLEALAIVIGYLIGSIPTAYLAGRWIGGVDIRKVGGGNMGALNASREIGPAVGLIVLLIDAGKGAAVIIIAQSLGVSLLWVYLAGFAAVLGHCWPVFLKFRGGKGAATTIGVFLALAPLSFACALPLLLATIFLTSNVTLSMAAGFILYPLFLWVFGQPFSTIIYALLVALFLAFRYWPTAKRTFIRAGNIRDFIIEKNFKPWQTRRDKTPRP
jgi:acyl phosphate:glycerol-3-phosphate acyltransferase